MPTLDSDIVSPRISRLLKAIGTDTLTRRGISGNMGLRSRKNLWDMYITPAMAQGYVRMLYPDHPNSPDQAYFLTKKGIAALEAAETAENDIKG